jgi:hypothetical protein
MSANCVQLGMPPDCVLDDEVRGKKMLLIVTTTNDAHEALAANPNTGIRATSITLTTRREAASEVYVGANQSVPPELGVDAFMPPAQAGPGETDLTSCPALLEKLVGQSDAAELGEQLRPILGCYGLPYIKKSYDTTCAVQHDGTTGPAAVVVSVWVYVTCAVPA